MPSFLSDDDRCGNDLGDLMNQGPGAIKQSLMLGYIFALPFMILGKIVGGVADTVAAANAREQQRTIYEKPPKAEPPPWTRQQYYQPPPAPPPPPDPLEKFRLILGVSKNANKAEIKKRYRFKSHCCHPDKVAESMKDEAEEEFKRINEAYQVLYAVAPEAPAKPRAQGKRAETATQGPTPRPPEPQRASAQTRTAKQATPPPAPAAAQPKSVNATIMDSLKNTGTKGFKPRYF